MTSFHPFRGLLYDDPSPDAVEGVVDLSAVVGDTTGPFSVTRLSSEPDLLGTWLHSGILHFDDQPALYMFRSGWKDDNGTPRQTAGVIGLSGDARQVFITPTCLHLDAPAFSDLLIPIDLPLARATDGKGVHHRLWPLRQHGVIATICEAVGQLGELPSGLVSVSADGAEPPAGLVLAAAITSDNER